VSKSSIFQRSGRVSLVVGKKLVDPESGRNPCQGVRESEAKSVSQQYGGMERRKDGLTRKDVKDYVIPH